MKLSNILTFGPLKHQHNRCLNVDVSLSGTTVNPPYSAHFIRYEASPCRLYLKVFWQRCRCSCLHTAGSYKYQLCFPPSDKTFAPSLVLNVKNNFEQSCRESVTITWSFIFCFSSFPVSTVECFHVGAVGVFAVSHLRLAQTEGVVQKGWKTRERQHV